VPEATTLARPCRSCGTPALELFLDLGSTPLADALVDPADLGRPEDRFPLEVAFCEACALVQVPEEVPPEKLFVENYHYYSSFSDVVLDHSRRHAEHLIASRPLGSRGLVVEIGSNDGYMLRHFAERGTTVLGIDPSPGPAAAAAADGIPTVTEFFGRALATKLRAEGLAADVIIANNVMAHVPDLNGFVEGLRILIADDGVITVENPYVRDLIEHAEFDTIYHEHLCYFSCTSLDALVRAHGLFLNHVEYFPDLHGGTLRWWIGPNEDVSDECERYLREEGVIGLAQFDYYRDFASRVEEIRSELCALLSGLKADGRTVAAYGAAAKGATLLNYTGIGRDILDFVVDRNVHKQGKHMPGVGLPILPTEALLDRQPDYVLLLAWNFKDEIVNQQSEYVLRGGRFIVPVPNPAII
jgi:SAM-dependent methyltransferase